MGDAVVKRAAPVVLAVVGAAFIVVAVLAVRARRNEWWRRTEAICACGAPVRERLEHLRAEATGGLAEVAGEQATVLQFDCEDLRLAVSRRTVSDEFGRRALRVVATEGHFDHARRLARSLDAMCGSVNEPFWRALADDLALPQGTPPPADPFGVRATAARHVALRTAMCADRAALQTLPRSYDLTAAEADASARECAAAVR